MLFLYSISTDRADVYFPPNDKDKHTKWPPSPHVLSETHLLLYFFSLSFWKPIRNLNASHFIKRMYSADHAEVSLNFLKSLYFVSGV